MCVPLLRSTVVREEVYRPLGDVGQDSLRSKILDALTDLKTTRNTLKRHQIGSQARDDGAGTRRSRRGCLKKEKKNLSTNADTQNAKMRYTY
jgi:hypothetical protein